MAFNPLPQSWFTGLTDDGTDLSIPISTFPELTAEELDSVDGDVRKFLYAFMEKTWAEYTSLTTATKPTKMTITKTSSVNTSLGIITNTYTLQFKNVISSQDVAPET